MGNPKWAAALVMCAFALQATVPTGWFLAGTKPHDYDCSIDPGATYDGHPSTYLKSKPGIKATGFGTMMQDFSAAPYAGKRVRLSANLKSEAVESWGGLWMRIDDANHPNPNNGHPSVVAFDNMHSRAIKGTTGWRNYSLVLDVPEGATGIYIGFQLDGPGALWVNGIKLEVVGHEVPVTGQPLNQPAPQGPTNLNFEK
jgi:hypothetical protein